MRRATFIREIVDIYINTGCYIPTVTLLKCLSPAGHLFSVWQLVQCWVIFSHGLEGLVMFANAYYALGCEISP